MFLLLLTICIIMIVVGVIWFNTTRSEEGECGAVIIGVIGAFGTVVFLICTLCSVSDVVKSRHISERIAVYEEQNAEIEEEINVMVENYMKFETETYGQFKSENKNGMTLIQLYPELKSDVLVQQQIQIHTENNAKIKELKEKQIDYKSSKWWLYFGG